jgi:cyclopropane-fatty-acyl-phospholipid synthase
MHDTQPLAARAVPLLDEIAGGAFTRRPFALTLWDGSELPATEPAQGPAGLRSGVHGNGAAARDASANGLPRLRARSPRALAQLLREPSELGLARAWVRGDLDLDGDAETALTACLRYEGVRLTVADRVRGLALARRLGLRARDLRLPPPPAAEARLHGRRHSLRRDRIAVRHHYDVSTGFYRLVLGPSLVYSCAYWAQQGETLEEAQTRKLDLVCRKLDLQPGERLLDVGCGWGSLLLHAAAHYGVRAVGITLSASQAAEARRRAAEAGLTDRVEVRVADYRELDDGPYDKIASVGMVEHVGVSLLETYARQAARLLRPGGRILNHGIVRLRPKPHSERSFIARYVFPDGELHPLSEVIVALEHAGLEVRDVEALREHYPLTLRAWSRNLARHRREAIAHAGAERERVWRLYMAGSALAFARGEIGVFQTLAVRPGAAHGLPLVRDFGEPRIERAPALAA